jgi:hypothetical protein
MKMIIIEGIENAGKTTFCRRLLNSMSMSMHNHERFLCERQDDENNWFDYNEEKLNGVDFMAIFEYAGMNIGLISHADNLKSFRCGYIRLNKKLNKIDNNRGFDYLICCSRTKNCKNSVKRYLCEKFKDKGKTIKVINKNENRTYEYEGHKNATVEEAVNFVIEILESCKQ